MKVIRFVFAPFFWLRDIRDSLAHIEGLLRWEYCLNVRYSPLSASRKKILLTAMLNKKKKNRGVAAEDGITATALLKALELND